MQTTTVPGEGLCNLPGALLMLTMIRELFLLKSILGIEMLLEWERGVN
jgi:hypothetical protein